MSGTITPVDEFTATIPDVKNGDDGNELTFHAPLQGLTNRTHNTNLTLTTRGVPRIRAVADSAALVALTGMTSGDHAVVKNQGLYQYDAASGAALSSPFVLAATGGGRWALVGSTAAGVPNGFATLDGGAKVPSASLRGHLLSRASATVPATPAATVSTPNQALGGPFGSTTLAIGQVLEFEVALEARKSTGVNADGVAIALVVRVLDALGSPVGELPGTNVVVGYFNPGTYAKYGVRGTYQAASAGVHQLQLAGTAVGSDGATISVLASVGRLSVWQAP